MATLSPAVNPASGPAHSHGAIRSYVQSIVDFFSLFERAIVAAQSYEQLSRYSTDELKALGFEHGNASRAVFELYIK